MTFLSLHFCPLGGVGSTRNWNFISFPWFHLIKTVYRKQSIWFIRGFFCWKQLQAMSENDNIKSDENQLKQLLGPKTKTKSWKSTSPESLTAQSNALPPNSHNTLLYISCKKCGATAHTEGACVSVFEIRSTCIIFTTDTWQQRSRPRITAAVRLINGSEDNSTC